MSVSLGLKGKDFSVIAADTRGTYNNCYDDYTEKLFLTPFGWFALSGGIYKVKMFSEQYLNSCKIKTRRDIYRYWLISIKKTSEFFKEKLPDSFTEIDREICTSHAIYSLNFFKNDALHMGIETLDFFGKRSLNAENILIVNPPKETKRIKRLITKYEDKTKQITNMHEAVYIIACFIDELSKLNRWISNIVDCGISYKLSDTELIYMRVKDKAKVIKKLYKTKGDLSEIMMVCVNPLFEKVEQ